MFLVLAAAAVALAGCGIVALAAGERPQRGKLGVSPVAILAGGAFVVVLLVAGAAFVMVGTDGGDDGNDGSDPKPGTPPAAAPRAAVPAQPVVTTGLPTIVVRAADADRLSTTAAMGGLRPDAVVRVKASGFRRFEVGSVNLCVSALGAPTRCVAPFPVQFDEMGGADVQYQLRADAVPGGCRRDRAGCTVRVLGTASGRRGDAPVVAVDAVGSARVSVEPGRGLRDGQTVDVVVSGLSPGVDVTAMLCAAPGGYDSSRCARGRSAVSFRSDGQGAAHGRLLVDTGREGTEGAPCGPRSACGVTVLTGEGFVVGPSVALGFSLGPGATYEAGRLALGLGVAGALLLTAAALVRRTDWSAPSEAASPTLDAADLETDRSLDDLFGTEEELDARYPIST